VTSTPRVGVNLLWLVPGVVGGSEEYTVRLLAALADRLGSRVDVVLFVNRSLPGAHPDLVERYRTVVAPVGGGHKAVRVAAETSWLARAARRHRVGLVHHMGGILPLVQPVPSVLTLHDLQPLAMPEHFHPAKRAFHRLVLPWSARTAERIVTLTEFTRADLCERLHVDPAKVVVVPSGVEPDPEAPTLAVVESVRRRYGVAERPYFLYPAITYPHKNHALLVAAMARLHTERPDVRLVLTGGAARCEDPLAEPVHRLGLDHVVVRTGRIPADDLDALYHGATGLTFPSLFEGFGLPVLEAMARGCPVLAARATALPEVVGEAGLLLAPDDPEEWAKAMESLIDDPQRAGALAEAGRRRAADFAWADAAATVERVWCEVLGREVPA
jgi:alpha-1,3-rhamnosyl/mannosyltransferase